MATADLALVQRRRWTPTVVLQGLQRLLHTAMFEATITGRRVGPPPQLVLATRYLPGFRRIPTRLVALGPRPEHAPAFARRPAGLV
ncbi:hypothetical protein ACFC1R_13055 [Kitasatospora sp. NPDC056138]|uniref:hypothetical protein n=1 Tax=Kitasatospora sp. NPDC056138 TaxID=3345724 RepID=UPI0035D5BC24